MRRRRFVCWKRCNEHDYGGRQRVMYAEEKGVALKGKGVA